jgi:hypothetical protein
MNQPYYRGTKSSQICDDHCFTQLVWFWYDNLSHTINGYESHLHWWIFGVRGYSCLNWQVFFCMEVNWGLQIMHRILKLVVQLLSLSGGPFGSSLVCGCALQLATLMYPIPPANSTLALSVPRLLARSLSLSLSLSSAALPPCVTEQRRLRS